MSDTKLVTEKDLRSLEDAVRNLWMSSDDNNKKTYDRICKWLDSLSVFTHAMPKSDSEQRMLHDYPKLLEFFTKHAMGSKIKPSCFKCGGNKYQPAIKHAELPNIHICDACFATPQPSTDVSELEKAENRLNFMIDETCWIQSTKTDAGGVAYQLWTQNEDEEFYTLHSSTEFFKTPRDAIDAAIIAKHTVK